MKVGVNSKLQPNNYNRFVHGGVVQYLVPVLVPNECLVTLCIIHVQLTVALLLLPKMDLSCHTLAQLLVQGWIFFVTSQWVMIVKNTLCVVQKESGSQTLETFVDQLQIQVQDL